MVVGEGVEPLEEYCKCACGVLTEALARLKNEFLIADEKFISLDGDTIGTLSGSFESISDSDGTFLVGGIVDGIVVGILVGV